MVSQVKKLSNYVNRTWPSIQAEEMFTCSVQGKSPLFFFFTNTSNHLTSYSSSNPILPVNNQELRKMNLLAPGHTAYKKQSPQENHKPQKSPCSL